MENKQFKQLCEEKKWFRRFEFEIQNQPIAICTIDDIGDCTGNWTHVVICNLSNDQFVTLPWSEEMAAIFGSWFHNRYKDEIANKTA